MEYRKILATLSIFHSINYQIVKLQQISTLIKHISSEIGVLYIIIKHHSANIFFSPTPSPQCD